MFVSFCSFVLWQAACYLNKGKGEKHNFVPKRLTCCLFVCLSVCLSVCFAGVRVGVVMFLGMLVLFVGLITIGVYYDCDNVDVDEEEDYD